ncbi:hypothetical protein O6H91_Y434300 [Diphasiastrum complanatum]|nr:hypothetical protein O6H91_Y434300 [Diphasiastrum complanatum]
MEDTCHKSCKKEENASILSYSEFLWRCSYPSFCFLHNNNSIRCGILAQSDLQHVSHSFEFPRSLTDLSFSIPSINNCERGMSVAYSIPFRACLAMGATKIASLL